MPGMPPIPAGGPAGGCSSTGRSQMKDSAVPMIDAIDCASDSAVRTTFLGSMMPSAYMSTYCSVLALKPISGLSNLSTSPTMTAPSRPALAAIVRTGARSAFFTISIPVRVSRSGASFSICSSALLAQRRAVPPPGTMPSCTAARVALSASMTRSFFSCTSTSEAPPTLMTATPPDILARRSESFSCSKSLVVLFRDSRSRSQRSSIASREPLPSRRMVSSFVMVTVLQEPSCASVVFSSLCPVSSEMTVAPVSTAMSCIVALRLSPKPGDLTAHTLRLARSLFTTSVASASDSTSSAMMRSGRPVCTVFSRTGMRDCMLLIFFSTRRM
mmetsp:Transcript_3069/g.12377  ORF Transcript_3069/g.12377 Transcript_3069/m.12377 type:complete len:329 (-) Transcript_3069:784-1770(-)